jgi:TonB-linked SusC/RagA family outer membrane protein
MKKKSGFRGLMPPIWNKKCFRIMKLTILFLFLGLMQVSASLYSQNTKLNLDFRNARVVDLLEAIENQSEFKFAYSTEYIDMNRRVSVELKNKSIEETLSVIFNGTNVNYSIDDRHILLYKEGISSAAEQPQKKVTGKVTDVSGAPLPGVTVVLKGATNGTITDSNGIYSISNLPENAVLLFSFIGMKAQEKPIAGKAQINVVMLEESIGVDEVVVTALGIKRMEKALGYSVQAVDGNVVQTVKGVDVSTSLTGQVTGLRVLNTTEFTDEASLVLRGENPLLVLDGVPYGNMRLRDIPADDIESVDVLKGATASALYGAQGGSGAIMVTTKKGLKKNGLSISLNSSTMFNAGFVALPEVQSKYGRNFTKRSDGKYEVLSNDVYSFGQPFEGQLVYQWDPITKTKMEAPYLALGKDNFKNFLEQGYVLNNNINVTQQSDVGSLRTSASWVDNKGIYPNSQFNKITFSVGGEMKFKKMQISSNVSYNKQKTPNKGFGGYRAYDPMYSLLIRGTIDYDIRNYKDYWLIPNESQNNSYSADVQNAYFDRYERTNGFNRDILNGNVTINYEFSPWLKALARVGYDTYSIRNEIRVSKGSFQGAGTASIGGNEVWGESLKGSYNAGIDRGYSMTSDGILMFEKKLKDFSFDALAGVSFAYKRDESMWAFTQGGLSIPGYFSLNSSVSPKVAGEKLYQKQTNSAYGKAGVSWKNLVFAEGTFRNDWVSTLPESTRSYFYPSVSGSFLASELLKEIKWMSLWKFRGSWTTVKIPADIYAINNVISITNPAWGTFSSASAPSTIRPTDLFPQAATSLEIGSNINVLSNRMSFDFTYYQKKGFDFIKSSSVSPISGYGSIFMNTLEERTRKGVEMTLKATPVKTRDLQWDLMFNWTKDAQYFTKVDPLYTTNVDKPWVGVNKRTDAFVSNDFLRDPGGNIIYLNGIPQYSKYLSLFGYADPDWMWGLSTSLSYKNFRFNINLDGRVGGLITSYTEMYLWNTGNHILSQDEPARYKDATVAGSMNYIGNGVKVTSGTVTFDAIGNITADSRVYAPNDVATTYKTYLQNYHKSIAWGGNPSPAEILDGTFLKIREISLSYDVPSELVSKVKMKGASISFIGQNFFMWAKEFKYSDPDGGTENFADPSQRYLGFNLKIDF